MPVMAMLRGSVFQEPGCVSCPTVLQGSPKSTEDSVVRSVNDYENETWMSHSIFTVSKTGKPSAGVSPLENIYPPHFLLLCPSWRAKECILNENPWPKSSRLLWKSHHFKASLLCSPQDQGAGLEDSDCTFAQQQANLRGDSGLQGRNGDVNTLFGVILLHTGGVVADLGRVFPLEAFHNAVLLLRQLAYLHSCCQVNTWFCEGKLQESQGNYLMI